MWKSRFGRSRVGIGGDVGLFCFLESGEYDLREDVACFALLL